MMNSTDWPLLSSGLAVLISLAGFFLSILAFRRSLPKLRIEAQTALVIDGESNDSRSMVIVKVYNDGGAVAQVGSVFLDSLDRSLRENPTRGPSVPYELSANGGQGVWLFDYMQLRQREQDQVRDASLRVRATVQVGTRLYRQKGHIPVPPLDHGAIRTNPRLRVERCRAWLQRLTNPPSVVVYPFVRSSDIDLPGGTVVLRLINSGWRPTRSYFLALTVWHADGHRDRVPGVDRVLVPRVWPRRQLTIRVPLVDVPAPLKDDRFFWSITTGRAVGTAFGAHTRAEAESLIRAAEARTRPTVPPSPQSGDDPLRNDATT